MIQLHTLKQIYFFLYLNVNIEKKEKRSESLKVVIELPILGAARPQTEEATAR